MSSHPPRLHQKVAIVTGASSGLGRAIALAYASHGTKLIVCADLGPDSRAGEGTPTHEKICELYGEGKAVFVKCDVGEAKDVESAVKSAAERGGRLDIMVNNAGLGGAGRTVRIHDMTEEYWEMTMRVNVRGVFLGCKYACAQFLRQGPDASGRKGWIVNTASVLGSVGLRGGAAAYCASKGAVLNLTKQVAVDYATDKIHCNALCPGFTKTAMTKNIYEHEEDSAAMAAATPWGDWGNAEDVAKGAVFLASDDAAWVTGIGLPVDGGWLAQ
ncbi:hypothetical protein MMC30_008463 [Trapelia coarctata]|nr:hypothetical protein [Trapelia coarctata]